MKSIKIILLAIIILPFFFYSCSDDNPLGSQGNNPPIIASITATPSDPDQGDTSQLVVIAVDPEEQELSYSWTTTGGVFITPTTSDTVFWQAPDSYGSFISTVDVSDGQNTVSKNITITVTEHPLLSIDQDSLVFGTSAEILNFTISNVGTGTLIWSLNTTTDDEGTWISNATPSNGSTTSNEQVSVEVDRSGLESGPYYGWIKVTSNDGSDSIRIIMDVPEPYDFFDDFSQGDGNWTYEGCTHSIINGELEMVSTEATAQSRAISFTFSPYLDIPWTFIGDITIVSSSSKKTDNGLSVHLNDTGTFDVEHMWLSVRKNSSSVNWIWLWWIPSAGTTWLPWDGDCYGNSSYVYTNAQKNTLEMSVSSNKKFTLKANDYTLSSDNDAVNELEYLLGITVGLKVIYLKLRGGNETTTRWDNIIFDSETSPLVKTQKITAPPPPSDEYVDGILDRIEQGEDVTIKSLLKKKLNN